MTKGVGIGGLFIVLIIILVVGVIAVGKSFYNTQVACEATQDSCEAIKVELVNVQAQLHRAEQDQWLFFLGGLIGGWVLNLFTPANLLNFVKALSTGDIRQNRAENPLQEHIQRDSIIANVSSQKFSEVAQMPSHILSTNLCPKCGSPMEVQMATKGRHKGKLFFVCPNYRQCKQVLSTS